MKVSPFLVAALWAGLAPGLAVAEVCVRGAIDGHFGPAPLDFCTIQFNFEDSFGISGVYVNTLPSLTKTGSGHPQVGIELGHREMVDVLEASSLKIGKSLNVAVSEFETALREDICAGAYTDFLEAGGALHVWFEVGQMTATEDPVGFGLVRVSLIDFEIDSLKDCEAI